MAETPITGAALRQAGVLLNCAATLANETDRGCCLTHGELVGSDGQTGAHFAGHG